MRRIGLGLLAAAAFFSIGSSARADLTGDSVDIQYQYNNGTPSNTDLGTTTVPGSETLNTGNGEIEITVTGDLVTVTNNGTGVDFQPATFNGFSVADVTQNPNIVGVEFLQGSSTVPSNFLSGPGSEVTTFTSDEVFFNFAGENWCNCADFTAEFLLLFGTNNNVPEPPTVALLGAALAGLGLFLVRRRRRRDDSAQTIAA